MSFEPRYMLLPAALVALIMSLWSTPLRADKPEPLKHVMAQRYYFREPTDRAWTLKVTARIPSLAGVYFILHNASGKVLFRGLIPHGEYSSEKPFVINFPADGVTGDYKLHILGHQNDFLAFNLPLSDLPFETYGGEWFSVGGIKTPVPFRVRSDVNLLGMRTWKGHLQVFDDQMQLVADSRAGLKLMEPNESNKAFYNKLHNPVEFVVDPKKHYWFVGDTFYFEPRGPIFLSSIPEKLFEPDVKLEAFQWWNL